MTETREQFLERKYRELDEIEIALQSAPWGEAEELKYKRTGVWQEIEEVEAKL